MNQRDESEKMLKNIFFNYIFGIPVCKIKNMITFVARKY